MQKPELQQIDIVQLPVEAWRDYRQIRLEALHDAPQAFGSIYQEQLVKPDDYWQSRLEDAAKGENSWLLFARSGDQLIGIIGAFRANSEAEPARGPEATIVSVYVTPAARGRGVSSLLMQGILDVLKEHGFHRVQLGVNIEQAAALGLYQRFGFTIFETEDHLMGDGAIHTEALMAKTLD